MTEYKTMRVPVDAWNAAQEARKDNETWGDYLRRCADEPTLNMSEDEVRRIARAEIRDTVVENARL